ncbi:GTP 3',8-cyclase MoaA [Desulfovibrio sp.]
MILTDARQRVVSYLRISVTDRCNLRCLYCSAQEQAFIPHPEILRYEELLEVIALARSLSIGKVRFTGGEPFARRGFPEFVAEVLARFPDLDARVTTNATLIGPHLAFLRGQGLSRLNISLDTLDPATFARVTGRDLFPQVWENIQAALDLGFRVKINAVAMKGVNDGELGAFLDLARSRPLDVRFIEFMPMGGSDWSPEAVWTAGEILEAAQKLADLAPLPRNSADQGPAQVYSIAGGQGRFGLISPLTNHFCGTCNRLRLTADGHLRTCLFSDKVYRLKGILRHPRLGAEQLRKVLLLAGARKPLGHEILEKRARGRGVCGTSMSAIGG